MIKSEKIKEITRENGSTRANIKFGYSGTGKVVTMKVSTSDNQWLYTDEYVHDAQGNIMATYVRQNDEATQAQSYKLTGRYMYGSSLIGIDKQEIELIGAPPVDTTEYTRTLGYKQYSLKNHLGNVLSTVSNKKIAVDADEDGIIDYWEANIISATDYGIFGENLKTRTFNAAAYPNSFNDKRDLVELDGWQDYGFRNYMKPERRFERVDPKWKLFSGESPYGYAGNNPIYYIDKNGETKVTYITTIDAEGTKATIAIVDDDYVEYWATGQGVFSHDVEVRVTIDLETGTKTKKTILHRRQNFLAEWADIFKEHVSKFEKKLSGSGGKLKGGIYLTSEDGGIDPTKYVSESDVEQIDVTDILAYTGASKLAGPPSLDDFAGKVQQAISLIELGKEAYEASGGDSDIGKDIHEQTDNSNLFKCIPCAAAGKDSIYKSEGGKNVPAKGNTTNEKVTHY